MGSIPKEFKGKPYPLYSQLLKENLELKKKILELNEELERLKNE